MGQSSNIEEEVVTFKETSGISDVVVVSRSGMHIAGDIPKGAHLETFVAMSAILLGAAETATSELKEELSDIHIYLKKAVMIVNSAGPKALLVVKVNDREKIPDVMENLKKLSDRIKDSF